MNRPPLYPAQITHIFLHKVGQPPPTHPHLVFEVDLQKRVNFIQPVGDCVIWSDVEVIEGGVSVARHAWIHTAAERVVGVAGVVGEMICVIVSLATRPHRSLDQNRRGWRKEAKASKQDKKMHTKEPNRGSAKER